MTLSTTAKIIDFDSRYKERIGYECLAIGKSLAKRIDEVGDFFGLNVSTHSPDFLTEELTRIEKVAFDCFGLDHEDDDIFALHFEFLHGGLSIEEFVRYAKQRQENKRKENK
jgi:hypothetical protein